MVGVCENNNEEKCGELSFCDVCELCTDHCIESGCGASMSDESFEAELNRF